MSATYTTRAWSCSVRLVVDDPNVLRPAAADLVALLERVDRVASRFRADSSVSVANARAGRPTAIPRLLVDLVEAALQAAAQTGGLVDPTLGRTLCELGYDRDISEVLGSEASSGSDVSGGDVGGGERPTVAGPRRRSWRDVRLDRAAGLLTVPAGTALDLGATTKAYVADHAAAALHARYGTAVLVELGGDVAIAGNRPDGWCVEVAEREGDAGQLLLLRHGGLVTSTTTVRRWQRGGTDVHHIVDPRSGLPADGPWRTVSVAAPCALAANVASTAAIVLGQGAQAWLDERTIAARLVARDGSITTTAGWPAPARTLELAS